MKRALGIFVAVQIAYRIRQRGWRLVEHDLIDHPLMTLAPRLGERLHDRHNFGPAPTRTLDEIFDELHAMAAAGDIVLPHDDATVLDEVREYLRPPTTRRRCYVCGCTDTIACHGGCSWSHRDAQGHDICTACVAPESPTTGKSWGQYVFGNPPDPEFLELPIGQQVAMAQSLRIKAHRRNGSPLPADLR